MYLIQNTDPEYKQTYYFLNFSKSSGGIVWGCVGNHKLTYFETREEAETVHKKITDYLPSLKPQSRIVSLKLNKHIA